MELSQLNTIRRKLADLADTEETSNALRAYLNTTLQRDIVDVIHEIEVLSSTLSAREFTD
ncbi:MAG: hypothetical protein P1U83_11180 [Roseovarius sp.]|nr:hypothetical protein [Roseovarius sp.]